MKHKLGYLAATIGYMVAIMLVSAPAEEGRTWASLVAAVVQVPLFAGLAACTLFCLTDGEWRRDVSWRLYTVVMAVSGAYAGLAEWYAVTSGRTASFGDFLLNMAGAIGLLVAHWLAVRQGLI